VASASCAVLSGCCGADAFDRAEERPGRASKGNSVVGSQPLEYRRNVCLRVAINTGKNEGGETVWGVGQRKGGRGGRKSIKTEGHRMPRVVAHVEGPSRTLLY